jgi:hypothetical protein
MPNNRAFSDPTPRVWRYKEIKEKPSVIYVIQPEGLDFVKIGQTRDLYPRLSGIQTGSPFELRILFVLLGGLDLEGEIHNKLQCHRQRGEWFVLSDFVRGYLDELRKDAIDYDAMLDELLIKSRKEYREGLAARVRELSGRA